MKASFDVLLGKLIQHDHSDVLLLDGSRAMDYDSEFKVDIIKLIDSALGSVAIIKTGETSNEILFRTGIDDDYANLIFGYAKFDSMQGLYSTCCLYTRGLLASDTFLFYDAFISETCAQFGNGEFSIPRGGNIILLDDKFLKIGKDSDGILPTPDASYRGKMIRVEGGVGVADELYICKWNGTAYKWFKINMTEV